MIQNSAASQQSISKLSPRFLKILQGVFLGCLILFLWNYHSGYDQSIDWEVITTAEVIEFPAWSMDNGLMLHEIAGDKYLLQERYSGSEIKRNIIAEQVYLAIIWLGLCVFLTASSYFNRYVFITVIAAFALMINRLNLFEVGLFGINERMVMLIPFLFIAGPLIFFQEYGKKASFILRLGTLLFISIILMFGIADRVAFIDHFSAHSVFPLGIMVLIFLLLISEEILFAMLFVVTSGKNGKSNHIHFTLLSLIYLGNLILYYLNRTGLFENEFYFFDSFVLLAISCLVSMWSLRFKNDFFKSYLPQGMISVVFLGLGISTLSFLSFSMHRGLDAIYQSFHYFIPYFHIGFGILFFLYIISNFVDPLIKGFSVYKIAYRERNFPYATAKLGGLVCVAAFYFYSGQEAYNLLRSGYYSYQGIIEESKENDLLSKEFFIQAGFLGAKTHFPNYNLGWKEWNAGNEFMAKSNFFNAAQRFPSPYALVNYGNLHTEINPNKVRATYEEALRKLNSPEMENNLGLLHLEGNQTEQALEYFENTSSSDNWNQAPLVNKWNVYKKMELIDSGALVTNYVNGNYGVRANILTTLNESNGVSFELTGIENAAPLHRQAYLLNASYLFDHDSIPSLLSKELNVSMEARTNNRLAKALALYLYKKGEVNQAFIQLDELQANSHEYYKGEYLDMLGKLALDQGAYRLAKDYFDQAIELKHEASRINQLEAFAGLGDENQFTNSLLKIIKNDPGLTNYANDLLEKLKDYSPQEINPNSQSIDGLDSAQLILTAKKNAFDEDLIVDVIQELKVNGFGNGYDILVEAIEINPYSSTLLQAYILAAVEWNLIGYAENALERLRTMSSDSDYKLFLQKYEAQKAALEEEIW